MLGKADKKSRRAMRREARGTVDASRPRLSLGMEDRQDVVIRSAVVIVSGYVRLELAKANVFKDLKGRNVPSFWKDWKTSDGKDAFQAAGLLNRARKLAIPASVVLGSDQVSDVKIDWERNFRQRRQLLAHWVMGA
jgi:hypothetical protein